MTEKKLVGTIYKIQSGNRVYFGSTTQTLKKRITNHKCDAKKGRTACELVLEDDHTVEVIELFEYVNVEDLRKREDHYIENNECINKQRAYRTEEQKKEQLKKCRKKYSENNKEKERLRRKRYREKNKEKERLRCKRYREKNKEKINLRRLQKVECECGAFVSRTVLARHRKTQKHKNNI
jgi:hypothetical protein